MLRVVITDKHGWSGAGPGGNDSGMVVNGPLGRLIVTTADLREFHVLAGLITPTVEEDGLREVEGSLDMAVVEVVSADQDFAVDDFFGRRERTESLCWRRTARATVSG